MIRIAGSNQKVKALKILKIENLIKSIRGRQLFIVLSPVRIISVMWEAEHNE